MLCSNFNRVELLFKLAYIPLLNKWCVAYWKLMYAATGWHFVFHSSITPFSAHFFLFCLSVTHSPRWQALSRAQVTLAPPLPQRSRKGQSKTSLCFIVGLYPHQHIRSLQWINFLAFCIYMFSACSYVCVFLCKQALVCVWECPLVQSLLYLAHTDRWGQKGFYIVWRICIVTATAWVSCLLSSELLLPARCCFESNPFLHCGKKKLYHS